MGNSVSRREFIEGAAAVLGGAALAQSGLLEQAYADQATAPCRIVLPKEANVTNKILVAYASRCGSTAEVAVAVAHDFTARGFAAEARPADKVESVAGYRGVVIASAVRYGKWLPQAVAFVRSNRTALQHVPVAYLTVHLMNTGADDKSRTAREGYTQQAREIVQPCAQVFFAGKMDISKLSFSERLLCKMMKAKNTDQRDWPAIHSWANNVFAT